MKQAITDISHLTVGNGYASQGYRSAHTSGPEAITSIRDLFFRDDEQNHEHSHNNEHEHEHSHDNEHEHHSPACVIRCTDILEHIKTCPVCSKLYKHVEPIKKSWECKDENCYRNKSWYKDSKSSSGSSKNNQTTIVMGGLFIIMILLLMKILISMKK